MNSKLLSVALAACLSSPALAQNDAPRPSAEPVLSVGSESFATWADYVNSPLFRARGLRCLTPPRDPNAPESSLLPPGDCGANSTNPAAIYAPGATYRIPVVVHVITHNSGNNGFISQSLVQSQIDILNEDFRALAGSLGANGEDGGIEFFLATQDPQGNATNGITYTANTDWFNDNGNYWGPLHWDTDRYLNIYTNKASGALGYVPGLPQNGIVGSSADRVVVLWSSFGRNAPIGPPFNKGRTTTHEVGHYLGLYHTFDSGCGNNNNCNTTGDLICDTARNQNPNFGCNSNDTSCNSNDPVDNYMNYTNDTCMERFTSEQIRRMRCTLEFWRPSVYSTDGGAGNYCAGAVNSTGLGSSMDRMGSTSVGAQNLTLLAHELPSGVSGLFFYGAQQVQVPFGDGFRCVGGTTQRVLPVVTSDAFGTATRSVNWNAAYAAGIQAAGAGGASLNFQCWYRDTAAGMSGFNLSDGIEIPFQP